MRTLSDVKEFIVNQKINDLKIGFTDIDGVIRGKYISSEKFINSMEHGINFCNVIMGWDIEDQVYDRCSFTGWHTAFPDLKLKMIPKTCRPMPFKDNSIFLLTELSDEAKDLCPRSILGKILNRANNLGFEVLGGVEYEFYLFSETAQSLREKSFKNLKTSSSGSFGYSVLRSSVAGEFCQEILSMARTMRFPLEALHTEVGPGVWEAPIEVSKGIEIADRASLFKTFVKVLAQRNNYIATFMAKWSNQWPGQSGHLHLSLRSLQDSCVFHDASKTYGMSDVMQSFIAGQLYLLPDLFVIYAPTINSYSRLVPGFWAPTAINWGVEDRTAAIRVIPGSQKSQRIEFRVPAADTNPYLVLAASIAAGLWGIEKGLKLDMAMSGNAYAKGDSAHQKFPKTLTEAILKFKQSEIAREIFGDRFVEHFVETREWETEEFNKYVTDWELMRYFEAI